MPLVYRAETDLPASPDTVWCVLRDFEAYPTWNTFNPTAKTSGEIGATIRLVVVLHGIKVPAWERVRDLTAPERLAWGFSFGPVLWAERVQTIEATETGAHYVTVDTIGGWLSPLVGWLFHGALDAGFQTLVADLRDHPNWSR